MKPEEALKILESVTSNIQLSRKDHFVVLEALKVLESLVTKNKEN
jgi:hypothetical protein